MPPSSHRPQSSCPAPGTDGCSAGADRGDLPRIALAAAAIAVVMVGLAIYVRATRDDGTRPPSRAATEATPARPDGGDRDHRDLAPAAPPADPSCPQRCQVAGECPPIECECADNTTVTARSCVNFCCVQLDCTHECRDHDDPSDP